MADKNKKHFCNIVFIQDYEADEPIRIYNEEGIESVIEYLSDWDYGGESEHSLSVTEESPWGSGDTIEKHGEYILSINESIGYIGLTRMCEPLDE